MKNVIILLAFVLASCFVYAQNHARFHITILGSAYQPTVTQVDNHVSVLFSDESLNSLVSSFLIYRFERAYPASRFPDMHLIWRVEADSLSLMRVLQNYKPDVFMNGEEQSTPILLYTPNDYGLVTNGVQEDLDFIGAKAAWDITKGDPNVVIGVTDEDFDVNHPDLQGQIVNIRNNITPIAGHFHGTAVLGRVASSTDNGIGYAGIGFNCKLDISSTMGDWQLLQMSRDGLRILNASWHDGVPSSFYNPLTHLSMRLTYNEIYENGTITCFGAGNGRAVDGGVDAYVYPGSLDHNISVSSVGHANDIGVLSYWQGANGVPWCWKDVHEALYPMSNYNNDPVNYPQWLGKHTHNHNDRVDICAPGYGLKMLLNANTGGAAYEYSSGDGTSFASPQVAGSLGLMLSANKWLSPYQLEYILKQTSANLDVIPQNAAYVGRLGSGRLDAGSAVAVAQNYNCNTYSTQTFYIKGVEMNTICRPGLASNNVSPQLTPVMEYGQPPYTYQWEALAGNNVTLDATNIANPTVISSTGTHLLHYYLTVRDASPIQKVASKTIKIQLQTQAVYDIASRDSYMDMVNESNTQATLDPREWNIWQSPDIWNRRFQDGQTQHENPEYFSANPNYVYARVRNVGCINSPATANLRLYWTKASTGEDWADDWTIATYTNPSGQSIAAGGEITTTPISLPALAPGQSVIVSHPWYPIQPQQYDPNINSVDVCVLARVEESSTSPYGMTFPEVSLIRDNVRDNNNIVTRNLIVSDIYPDNKPIQKHFVFVGNPESISQIFDIEMQPDRNIHLHFAGDFSVVGKITLHLGSLFDIWQANGGEGNYQSIDFEQRSVTFDGNKSLQLSHILMPAETKYPIIVEIQTLTGQEISPISHNFYLSQYLVQSNRRTLYGNINFEVNTAQRNEQRQLMPQNETEYYVRIYPNPAKNTLYVENMEQEMQLNTIAIYDILGKEVIHLEETKLLPHKPFEIPIGELASGVYYLKVGKVKTYKFIKE